MVMETKSAVEMLAALAQPTRLDALRLLVRTGPSGLAAGEIATALNATASTLSFHLKELEGVGLLRSWRVGKSIRYAADVETMRQLLGWLTEDCCNGRPELCGDLTKLARCGCNET